tara:strand:+ start:1147 stop:1521 length:375 start_codon:yes stop_codon:yes gene_type:complete
MWVLLVMFCVLCVVIWIAFAIIGACFKVVTLPFSGESKANSPGAIAGPMTPELWKLYDMDYIEKALEQANSFSAVATEKAEEAYENGHITDAVMKRVRVLNKSAKEAYRTHAAKTKAAWKNYEN